MDNETKAHYVSALVGMAFGIGGTCLGYATYNHWYASTIIGLCLMVPILTLWIVYLLD